ncbi:root hair defective 3 GTP-binding protein [Piromyces finnis]|uniref:Root hair defective 3 GTP-binding protein n=1 Tax=Piromyces finnis TaxID=1754191 RepID=A0A1Y1VGU3_9FUNG|nr:root hair defective 3 GTP-binding protein [Piromyces finnis]|eukprot:ORX55242.1 root hair defective 3 GTP-binding protein [Piromyces finnis]
MLTTENFEEVNQVESANTKLKNPVSVDGNTSQIQIVDENKQFTKILSESMKNVWGLEQNGFNYHILSIFGSQSTGKSTLLNKLFNTKFQVMNEKSRQQTTKGIWISQGENSNLLILDVEGTDGRERGEEQEFERKSALFTLAISEVLVINIWENMVGLYQGANMGLLKTVFEVNMQLFLQQQGKIKTLLLFVIRDFTARTPLSNLSEVLTNELNKMWKDISKPEEYSESNLSDYFDLMFTTLPHKIYLPEQFENEVLQLKERFYNTEDPNYVFKPKYHRGIPADGFSSYAENIWDQVAYNHDLDIPTQQQLLAEYRCDEIAKAIIDEFQIDITKYKEKLEDGEILEDMGKIFNEVRDRSLELYDHSAGRYRKEVYNRKRIEFIEKMNTYLHVYYLLQLRNVEKKAYADFKNKITEAIKDDSLYFVEILEKQKSKSIEFFNQVAEDSKLIDTNWVFTDHLSQLTKEINEYGKITKDQQLNKIKKNSEKNTFNLLAASVPQKMNNVRDHLWDELGNDLEKALTNSIESYKTLINGYDCTDEEINDNVKSIRKNGWNAFCNLVAEETTDNIILVHLREKFEEIFRYDKSGLPRIWNNNDDIDSFFKKAKDEALALISLFTFIDISEQKIRKITGIEELQKEDLTIIDADRSKKILNKFLRDIELQYIDAKRSVVRTTSKVPPWFIILTMALGYNEFLSILKNPIYLIGIVLISVFIYVLYITNLLKPVIHVGQVIVQDILLQLKAKTEKKHKTNKVDTDNISYFDEDIPLSKLNRRKNKNNFDSNATLVNF